MRPKREDGASRGRGTRPMIRNVIVEAAVKRDTAVARIHVESRSSGWAQKWSRVGSKQHPGRVTVLGPGRGCGLGHGGWQANKRGTQAAVATSMTRASESKER